MFSEKFGENLLLFLNSVCMTIKYVRLRQKIKKIKTIQKMTLLSYKLPKSIVLFCNGHFVECKIDSDQ